VLGYLLRVLADEARHGGKTPQTVVAQSVTNALACRVLTRHAAAATALAARPGALGGPCLRRVVAFMDAKIGEHISLDDLARTAGLSRYHFARRFRLRTGESPLGYLLRLRVERAKSALVMSEGRIADIAASYGFADQSHFTRSFRRFVGMTPSDFYRQSRAERATVPKPANDLQRRAASGRRDVVGATPA